MKNIIFFSSRNKIIDKIIYFLIILLPLSLITGPFLSEISVLIITILFLYTSIKNKLFFYYTNTFSKFFGIFFLILIVTSLFSVDPLISLSKTIFYFRFWILSLSIWYILDKEQSIYKHLIISFSLCFVILIFDGYIQFFFKENLLGWPIDGSRISSFFKDELILGSYLSRLLPLLFALLIYKQSFDKNILLYSLFLIIFIGVETLTFLSGERVAFFYINLSALFLIISMQKYKVFRISSIVISVMLIALLINLYPKSFDRMISETVKQLSWDSKSGNLSNKKYIFSYEHHNHYTSAIKIFSDHKYLGAGPRMFRNLCNKKEYITSWESCSTHPHNNYVQILAETGLVGFIYVSLIFLIIFYQILKHIFFKYWKQKIIFSDYQLSLISCILISIWPFIPTGGFFNNWLSIIYFFPVGFLMHSLKINSIKVN